jgi:hypothetical protein
MLAASGSQESQQVEPLGIALVPSGFPMEQVEVEVRSAVLATQAAPQVVRAVLFSLCPALNHHQEMPHPRAPFASRILMV